MFFSFGTGGLGKGCYEHPPSNKGSMVVFQEAIFLWRIGWLKMIKLKIKSGFKPLIS